MHPKGSRLVRAVIPSEEAMEGAGVQIRRAIGIERLPDLDPFLLLDEIHSDEPDAYIAGFPPHPHRGIETVTYMLSGQMQHRDSTGGQGTITSGDVQWMTTGRGIIHSEMPGQASGLMWGFQLWVNLPAREKMRKPEYVELKTAQIPELHVANVSVRLLAGQWREMNGPAPERATQPLILDIRIRGQGECVVPIPEGLNAFAYVYEGSASMGPQGRQASVPGKSTAVLERDGDLKVESDHGVGFLLVAGKPLNEPIAKGGPFVMNTREELVQAFNDYQSGRLVAPADA